MSDLINKILCPEDAVMVLLPAHKIPDGAIISRRTGDYRYTLRHGVTVYPVPKTDAKPLKIDGFFVVNERGDINQVTPDTLLHWNTTAEGLVDTLRASWETDQ